jgi:CP family cyanate transporter-like MFS transporter
VLPALQADLRLSHSVAGLVATIPVLCQGLFAPVAAVVAAWFGTRRAVGACLVAICVFGLGRATSSGSLTLLGWTLLVGIGIGVAGAILPIAVKERFADRPATATGIYAGGIQVGAAVSAATAVPIAAHWGGWRGAFAVFALAAALSSVAWLLAVPREPRLQRSRAAIGLPWRSGTVWLLVAMFGLQAMPYYGLNAWLPAWLQGLGWTAAGTGAVLAAFNVAALTATLTIPRLADRRGSRRTYLVAAAGGFTIAMIVLLVAPSSAFVSVAAMGMTLGTAFTLSLTLPLDVAATPRDVGAASGLMLGGGYSIAALSPFVLGAVRDLTGSLTGGLWVLVLIGIVTTVVAASLSPARLSRGL